jgi:hypothetical protein
MEVRGWGKNVYNFHPLSIFSHPMDQSPRRQKLMMACGTLFTEMGGGLPLG